MRFIFGGIIATFVGTLISASAMMQQDYLWLIGSIPLIVGGIVLQFVEKPNKKQEWESEFK
jgi:hypothetical protein